MNSPVSPRTLANGLGIALLIAVVAPFVVYAVPAVVGAEYGFVVLTASMTPAIAPGDVVIVDDRDPATIAEGDVITFTRGSSEVPVTHRVVGVTATGGEFRFETKGDANDGPDSAAVPAANVLGTVAFSIPYIGYVIQFTDSSVGFLLLVVVPFGLLAMSEVWSLYRSRTRDGPAPDDSELTEESGATATETAAAAASASSEPGYAVTTQTVQGAVGVLVCVVPYAAYVAYTLRSALTIAVAVAAGTTLAMGAVLLVTSGRPRRPSDAADADDAAEADATEADDGPPSSASDRGDDSTEGIEESPVGPEPIVDGGTDDGAGVAASLPQPAAGIDEEGR
jgi:signal peptidase